MKPDVRNEVDDRIPWLEWQEWIYEHGRIDQDEWVFFIKDKDIVCADSDIPAMTNEIHFAHCSLPESNLL